MFVCYNRYGTAMLQAGLRDEGRVQSGAMSSGPASIAAAVVEADARIRPHALRTPLEPSPRFEELGGAACRVKLENLQRTGSFKVRGALNAVLSLAPADRADGIVVASTGNHGAAAAFAAGRVGVSALVFVPESTSPTKLAAIERLGAEIRRVGQDGIEAELAARDHSSRAGLPYVSPYNDPDVVAGQGTVGLEIAQQWPEVDALFVSVGGGGLISGIGGYLADRLPGVRLFGCSPRNSAVMAASVRAGRVLELESLPTLSDGTAGGVEEGAITLDPCIELVEEWILVSEDEIRSAMLEFIDSHHMLIEGSAAVALAAFVREAARLGVERAAVVACGANVGLDRLGEILCAGSGTGSRARQRAEEVSDG